jgi:hypothetical protein
MNPDGPTLDGFESFLENAYKTIEDPEEATSVLLSLERVRAFRREYRGLLEHQSGFLT